MRRMPGITLPERKADVLSQAGRRLLLSALLGLSANSYCADVFVSQAPDGTPIYSTQALDPSYHLLDKGVQERPNTPAAVLPESADLRKRREALEPLIRQVAARHGLDPALIRAIAHVESRFNARAVSPAGASGIMQLMPATASRFGVSNRSDPAQNLDAGAHYFKDLLGRYAGNVALALAAYNSGEQNVERNARRLPPFRETMLYVPEILARYESYRQMEVEKQQ